jgi:heat-inducible transcriptional repressor
MPLSDFDQRRNNILRLIVEAYVATAAPVGSEFIARKLRPAVSSATIRNVMSELEAMGYVEQPHTSAGRVPTERGYRFYVDAVMDQRRLPSDQLQQLAVAIEPGELDVAQLLERAGIALAELTQLGVFVVAPTVRHSKVRQIELVPLSVRKLLCVLIANEELIASHVVELEQPLSREEASALARFLNEELGGQPFEGLIDSLQRRLLAESDSFYYMVKRSLDILQHALSTEPSERLLWEGTSYLVAQPEFAGHPRRTHDLLRGLDTQAPLVERLRQDLAGRGVHVRIGHEIALPHLEACSYVTASFGIGPAAIGGIGVLGPTRMDYPQVRATVEATARCVTELLTRWEQGW